MKERFTAYLSIENLCSTGSHAACIVDKRYEAMRARNVTGGLGF